MMSRTLEVVLGASFQLNKTTKEKIDHPPLWTIERERSGDIRWTIEDEIKKHEISKIVVVG